HPADGRAVRRARLADPRAAARKAAVDLAQQAQDRAVRDPRHRRVDLLGDAAHRAHRAAGAHQGRYPRPGRRPHGRIPQIEGFRRPARAGVGPAARGGAQSAGAKGRRVRIRPTLLLNWALPLLTLVAWEVFGRLGMLPRYLSVPTQIAAALWEIAVSGELWVALVASLWRVTAGFTIGTAAGVRSGLGARR